MGRGKGGRKGGRRGRGGKEACSPMLTPRSATFAMCLGSRPPNLDFLVTSLLTYHYIVSCKTYTYSASRLINQ